MLVVKIELHPHGDASKARTLGTAEIVNDGSGTETTGNYKFRLLKWTDGKLWKSGVVHNFPRLALGPWDLLLLGLLSICGKRVGASDRVIDDALRTLSAFEEPAPAAPAVTGLFENQKATKPGHAN